MVDINSLVLKIISKNGEIMSNFYVILVIIRLTVATTGHLFEERRITKGWEDCKKQIEELKKGKDACLFRKASLIRSHP